MINPTPEKRTLKSEASLLGMGILALVSFVGMFFSAVFSMVGFFGGMVHTKLIPVALVLVALTGVLAFIALRSSEWTLKKYKATKGK